MILPTAYLPPRSYFEALMCEPVTIEQMETFEKQTFRNRALIRDAKGDLIRLTVPVGKVEHKQLTRDIEISYHPNPWRTNYFKSAGRGQEFVMEATPLIIEWAKHIIK